MDPHRFYLRVMVVATALLFTAAAARAASSTPVVMDVMLLPHSHQDAGFLVTYSHVRDTLADRCYRTIFECLDADRSKTFNVAEVNFFSHWFDRQNATVQTRVKQMTADGQYWFAEGGWVQPDEGCTTVLGRVNQATLGQEWLSERLGVFPSTGWHMDPFGNSAVSPKLFDAYGFDSHVVSAMRLPRSRMSYMDADVSQWHYHKQLQNVWRGSGGHAVFQHIIEHGYNALNTDPLWAGHGYNFETGLPADDQVEQHFLKRKHQVHRLAKLVDTSPPVNSSNVARLAADLVSRARTDLQWYQSTNDTRPTIALWWGTDWGFSIDAHIEFVNMDQIVQYVNAHSSELNATMRYGTFGEYLDIVHGGGSTAHKRTTPSHMSLPVVDGDFFPMDTECCGPITVPQKVWNCWTGYFSSFPALKFATRKLEHTLRHAEIVAALGTAAGTADAMVAQWEEALGWGRHTAGILQHHDAVTGTGGSACDQEFHTMLQNATDLAEQVLANATVELIGAPSPLQVYSLPVLPPNGPDSQCATHGCTAPAASTCAVSDYVDCAGHGAPPLPGGNSPEHCHRRGCCWQESASHSWCYLPKNESLHPQSPSTESTSDGTVLTVPPRGQHLPIVATNPLGWNRSDILSVRVLSAAPHLKVTTSSGKPVMAQLAPLEPGNASVTSQAAWHNDWAKWAAGGNPTGNLMTSRLIVGVGLLPLGSTTLFLSAASPADKDNVAISSIEIPDPTKRTGFEIANSAWSLRLNYAGLLEQATEQPQERTGRNTEEKRQTFSLDIHQDIAVYWGNSGRSIAGDGGSESDAYVFAPQGPASSIALEKQAGFWPGGIGNKSILSRSVIVKGPLMEEVSTCYGVKSVDSPVFTEYSDGTGGVWQAIRVFKLSPASAITDVERTIEMSYIVRPLNNNIDVISRFDTGLETDGLLHTDEAGWTDRAHSLNLDHFSFNSKVGCNYHPSSAWASVQAVTADGSMAMLTDRSRGGASLDDGSLEYVLHRHATGGNGRGPSDGDPNSARGTVTLVPSASSEGFAATVPSTPRLALLRAHPTAVLYGAPIASSPWPSNFSPLTRSLPEDVHLFSLQRRAFQALGGHVPAYAAGEPQGALRLQNLARDGSVEVDVSTLFRPLFSPHFTQLEERTLSLARRPDQVERRSWHGVGMRGDVITPPYWRGGASVPTNSSHVVLAPEDIRSFVFPLKRDNVTRDQKADRTVIKTDDLEYDVLVYGATSGGVTAAVAASRHGLKVGMIVANGGGCGPTEAGANHIGGMTTSGLGKTDIGAASKGGIIGGIALEFYSANAKHYNTTAPPSWDHEPHVAQASIDRLLSDSTVAIIRGLTVHGSNVVDVIKNGTRIVSLRTADGRVFAATAFIDSSYEGDLLAAAGGSWVVGREAKATYNESAAGRRADDFNRGYQFRVLVSPFDESGNVLPLLDAEDEPIRSPGEADSRVQAYNFRLCATSDVSAQAPFPSPDPASPFSSNDTWELARRYFADPSWKSAERPGVLTFERESPALDHRQHKRDWNNPFLSPLNSDCVVGCNQSGYPHATVEERLKIWEAHRNYYLSLIQFTRSDPAVPADVRATIRKWGLCADEFNATGHWPPQLYVRETRRMVGDSIFTQNSPQTISPTLGNASVGVGDYTFDSHPAQRFACRNGTDPRCAGATPPWLKAGQIETRPFAWSEGNVQQGTDPYAIPYWVMTPKRTELTNLLVTATPSGSHIGFSSLRMEPQFMVLGHSAGTAAALFVNNHTAGPTRAIQDVDSDALTAALLREGQVLQPPHTPPHTPKGSLAWVCEALGSAGPRCIAIGEPAPNSHRLRNCSGECQGLAPNEWLANVGFWKKVQSTPPQLVSTRRTFLKKGVAESNLLPPTLVKEVPEGFRCTLIPSTGKSFDGYDLCTV